MLSKQWRIYNLLYHVLCNIAIVSIIIGLYSIIPNVVLCIFLYVSLEYSEYKLSVYLFVKNNFFD